MWRYKIKFWRLYLPSMAQSDWMIVIRQLLLLDICIYCDGWSLVACGVEIVIHGKYLLINSLRRHTVSFYYMDTLSTWIMPCVLLYISVNDLLNIQKFCILARLDTTTLTPSSYLEKGLKGSRKYKLEESRHSNSSWLVDLTASRTTLVVE